MERIHIRGNTRLIGLLGNPVTHSLSPIFQNHALHALNAPFAYVPLGVEKHNLHIALHALRAFNFAGANVTVPYKNDVAPYCDIITGLSTITGAVNTLYFDNGLLAGTTTDAAGFFKALENDGCVLDNSNVVILGNGGTARTLGFAIAHENKAASLALLGRNGSRIAALCAEITDKTGMPVSPAILNTPETSPLLARCTLLVNCTAVGLAPDAGNSPLSPQAFHRGMYVFDAIYNPEQTRFLLYAQKAGCRTQNGLRMLLYQGLESLRYWIGAAVDENLFDLDELQAAL